MRNLGEISHDKLPPSTLTFVLPQQARAFFKMVKAAVRVLNVALRVRISALRVNNASLRVKISALRVLTAAL